MERALIIGKRIECIIGIILLIPFFLGVIAFVICLFKGSNDFYTLDNLSRTWSYSLQPFYTSRRFNSVEMVSSAGAMSSAPIYLGLMAIAGVWLIKDSLKYFFVKSK